MKTFISYLVAATALLIFCSCTSAMCNRRIVTKPTVKNALCIQVDDSVNHLLGDSLSHIIFEADTVKLFSLSVSLPKDSLKTDSSKTKSNPISQFHGCYINHDYGALSKSAISPILFILADRDNYLQDGVRLKTPFTPDVALSFKKGNANVDIVFSFTGGQMLLFMANDDELYFKYTYERLVMKYFQSFLKDDRITEYLNL